ncbi:MAG: TlpA disulfide reductase family protein [Bacteroidota bacterium]
MQIKGKGITLVEINNKNAMMKSIPFFLIVFFCSINAHAQVSALKVGDQFTLTEMKTTSGKIYSFDSLDSKVIVLNFWNIGCRGCEMERPFLNQLQKDYQFRDDVIFWSITLNEKEKIEDFLERYPISWEIKGGVDFIGPKDSTFMVKCMPTNMIIDKDRTVKHFECAPVGIGSEYTKVLTDILNP